MILVLFIYITTCIAHGGATRIWHVTVRSSPTTTFIRFASWSSGIYEFMIFIFFPSICHSFLLTVHCNVTQFFHTPSGHDGESSSHRNILTRRDNSVHSNHPSDDNNMWTSLTMRMCDCEPCLIMCSCVMWWKYCEFMCFVMTCVIIFSVFFKKWNP
jgi:hypothetical protein